MDAQQAMTVTRMLINRGLDRLREDSQLSSTEQFEQGVAVRCERLKGRVNVRVKVEGSVVEEISL
jgi:hypothetical protein